MHTVQAHFDSVSLPPKKCGAHVRPSVRACVHTMHAVRLPCRAVLQAPSTSCQSLSSAPPSTSSRRSRPSLAWRGPLGDGGDGEAGLRAVGRRAEEARRERRGRRARRGCVANPAATATAAGSVSAAAATFDDGGGALAACVHACGVSQRLAGMASSLVEGPARACPRLGWSGASPAAQPSGQGLAQPASAGPLRGWLHACSRLLVG